MVAHLPSRKARLLGYLYRRIAALEMENEQLLRECQALTESAQGHQALEEHLAQGADRELPPVHRSDGEVVPPSADMDRAAWRILELSHANE
jgi:hypothetical protein